MIRAIAIAIVTAIIFLVPVSAAAAGNGPARSPGPVFVSITTPQDGTVVSSEVNITGTASGPDGIDLLVRVSVDGGSPFLAQGNTIWVYRWSPSVEGPHLVEATAAAGNDTASAQITVSYSKPSKPLDISGHQPLESEISLVPGNNATFSINLSGEPKDATISWYLDNSPVPSEEGRLTFNFIAPADLLGNHIIEVRLVRNGTTLDAVGWNITGLAPDRPPRISSFLPDTLNISFEQYDSVDFNITASDPDGDNLTYTWLVDGKPLASGPDITSFSADFNGSGDHCVTASVSDGAFNISVTWNVSIQKAFIPTMLDFAPCAIYILLGLFLGIGYGIRTGRIPGPRQYLSPP
jgi:membrane carboxypeptidase/penicillin-binding protein PbpC